MADRSPLNFDYVFCIAVVEARKTRVTFGSDADRNPDPIPGYGSIQIFGSPDYGVVGCVPFNRNFMRSFWNRTEQFIRPASGM